MYNLRISGNIICHKLSKPPFLSVSCQFNGFPGQGRKILQSKAQRYYWYSDDDDDEKEQEWKNEWQDSKPWKDEGKDFNQQDGMKNRTSES